MIEHEETEERELSDINLTPMLDTLCVLLLIFMLTAPLIQRGMDLDLPASQTNTIGNNEERINILMTKNGEVMVNEEAVLHAQLLSVLESLKLKNPEVSVYLNADRDVPYGQVVAVMDAVKQAGIEKLGMVTMPVVEKQKRG